MALLDMFTTNRPSAISVESKKESIAGTPGAPYFADGFKDAGLASGSSDALLPKLHAIYMKLIRYIKEDEQKHNERKNETKQKISGIEAQIRNVESKIKTEKENLIQEESKITKLIADIDHIRGNPKSVSGDSFAKASFWIGAIIILFLTIYLFVFYSSAAYSAFFKNFTADDAEIVKSIFDAQAITKSLTDGFTELIFITAIPAVFLGLGFLIYKFSEEKGVSKYFKITGLIVTTFIFDFIIAYDIVEKIYDIKREGSFQDLPEMTIRMAAQQINFWVIIFAGFVVYIIWGFVFSFVMQEYEKIDKVRYAIKSKEKKLSEYKTECKNIKREISEWESQKESNQGEVDKLKIQLEGHVLYFNDVREGINDYVAGWISYMKGAAMPQIDIDICTQIKDKFLADVHNYEFIKSA